VIPGCEKAVEFDVECYAIMHEDRDTKMSILRITQTRGAASSLRKLCKELESNLMDHKAVVVDETLADQMRATLGLGLRKHDRKRNPKPVTINTKHYNPPDPEIKWWDLKDGQTVEITPTLEPYADTKK
jgi:hypothetical protein